MMRWANLALFTVTSSGMASSVVQAFTALEGSALFPPIKTVPKRFEESVIYPWVYLQVTVTPGHLHFKTPSSDKGPEILPQVDWQGHIFEHKEVKDSLEWLPMFYPIKQINSTFEFLQFLQKETQTACACVDAHTLTQTQNGIYPIR